MKLVVLGSGTCLGPRPGEPARMPPLYALDVAPPGAAPAWLLLECSEAARFRLPAAGIDPALIRHVAISHGHADHAALPQFVQGRACEALARPGRVADLALSVYLPAALAEALPQLWGWHQPEDGGRATSRYPLDIVPVSAGFAREILPGVVLQAFPVFHAHGRAPAVAYRVEAGGRVLAYSGDTGRCDGIVQAAAGASLFLCEAMARVGVDMSDGHGHLNPRQAGAVARQAGVALLVLTHYTGQDSGLVMLDDVRASGFGGQVVLAHDGLVVEL